VIAAAVILGLGIDFSSIDPIKALFWSAVINGFVAVPIMAAMMWVGSQRTQMARFRGSPLVLVFQVGKVLGAVRAHARASWGITWAPLVSRHGWRLWLPKKGRCEMAPAQEDRRALLSSHHL
jgi:Mn2+/Fe2+ NRAMP family transporter